MFWLSPHAALLENSLFPVPLELKQLMLDLWPFANDCFHQTPSLFLSQITTLKSLQQRPQWFVRDGYLGIWAFFQKFPRPGTLQTKLIIEKSWMALVPTAWRKNMKAWELVQIESPQSASRFFFSGLALRHALHEPEFLQTLASTSQFLKNRKKRAELLAWIPARSLNELPDGRTFHFDFFQRLFDALGTKISTFELGELLSQNHLSGLCFVNLFSRALISDDYMTALVVSHGGSAWGVRKVKDTSKMTEIASPYHGYVFSEPDFKNTLPSAFIDFEKSSLFLDVPLVHWMNWRDA